MICIKSSLTWKRSGMRTHGQFSCVRARGTDIICHLCQSYGPLIVEILPRQATSTSQDCLSRSTLMDLRELDGRATDLRSGLYALPCCCQPNHGLRVARSLSSLRDEPPVKKTSLCPSSPAPSLPSPPPSQQCPCFSKPKDFIRSASTLKCAAGGPYLPR